jgi:Flp pilus assembly pilin Flp
MKTMSAILKFRRDESGFTLIETLVAMISATVVVGALYAILIVAVDQTSKVTDTVYSTQAGRTTMTKLVDELHSACISSNFSPIQSGSNENRLIFFNAYTPNAEITSAYKHEIIWNKTTGTLIEKRYTSNGGSDPKFTFPTTYTEIRLGENISKTAAAKPATEKELPVFRYYRYTKTSSSLGANEALSTLSLLSPKTTEEELKTTELEEAAAVEINFKQAPLDKEITESRTVDFKNLVTLSFSVPNAETPIEDKPCE